MKRFILAGIVAFTSAAPLLLQAGDVLIINGAGDGGVVAPDLQAAGFGVVEAAFNPGVIATALAADPNIVEVWVWNDPSYGQTFVPADPSRAFNAADQAALAVFHAAHQNWIMDGLSWRGNSADEQNLTENEGLNLAGAGGGIVLGADDGSGAAIVQHVNQVAAWFNLNPFTGVYLTSPSSQQTGGSFFTTPNPVNPTGVVGTTTYSEVPNGLQPDGQFLGTALFGEGTPLQGYTPDPVPDLGSQVFNGVSYDDVNHLITTTIAGAAINNPVPDAGATLGLLSLALAGLAALRRRVF